MLVPGLNGPTAATLTTRFSPDELTAYLGMYYGLYSDIFVATRGSRSESFGMPTRLFDLNTTGTEEFATATADGLTVYIDSTRSGEFALYVSTRGSTTEAFPMPIAMGELNVDGEGAPYVTPDGSALYYHTHRNGHHDIYRARKTAAGFVDPTPLSINTDLTDGRPVVSADELTIYFYHDSEPRGPAGIWMATRSSVTDPFGPPISIKELNNLFPNPYPFWISPDGCRLYFGDQDEGGGAAWAYVAERTGVSRGDGGSGQ